MTLGDLLRQDGALILLGLGAVIGFFVGKAYRTREKGENDQAELKRPVAPGMTLTLPVPVSSQATSAAVIAAITAAINQYRTENS